MRDHQGTTRILIVDDDEDDFRIIGDYIRHIPGSSFRIEWCFRYSDALAHMLERNYDLYLVDYRLGARSGVDLLKEALAHNCAEPVILLTGEGNYKVDIEAMQLGAVDYLIKGELNVEKMERSIRYALERAATMKALKANERRYRSIFEKSRDLIFLTDGSLNIKDANDIALPLLGYTRDEIVGLNLCDLVEQSRQKTFLRQSLLERGAIDDWEVVLTTRAGERKHCMLTASFEKTDNDVDYVQGIIHDITNLKKAEKVTLQVEKLAATGRLVRTLAHEVRNPLNNITLSIEQMMQDVKDDQLAFYMSIIHRNGRRIGDLISELLNTSHMPEVKLENHHLQGILDDVVAASIDRLTLKHIGLEIAYPDTPVYILADREKLKMALLNIVINAVEAMEEREQGILSLSLQSDEDGCPVLRIRDNGCGISEEHISRLFEPYFTRKRNGVGLGLAFTLNILQAHRAEIDVASTEGQGTTFSISFPPAELLQEQLQSEEAGRLT